MAPYSDARKDPWHLDLTAGEFQEAMAMWPLLYELGRAASELGRAFPDYKRLDAAIVALDTAHPNWETWLTVEQKGSRP